MAFIESQLSPGVIAEVDPTFKALRTALRPLEYGNVQGRILGHYRAVAVTTAAAPAANSVLAALRWTDPASYLVLLRARCFITVVTAVTAQRNDPLVLTVARSYTARDATNATAVVISGNNQKARSNMGSSLVANLDVASAAAGLTGGTKTVDANPHYSVNIGASGLVGLGTNGGGEFMNAENNYLHPIVLGANEGILVDWGATILSTGTVTATVELAWAEVTLF
jgi:hypothetical protein